MYPLTLLRVAYNQPMLVELKNGETYNGNLASCDSWMNLHLKGEVICTSKDGENFWKMPEVYIRGSMIKYLRLPDEVMDIAKQSEKDGGKRRRRDDRGAALARTSPQIRRPFKFTPGQTYVYEYRGRQWNGLAQLADQYAGLTIDCDVILQAKPEADGKEVLMKLDDIKVEQLHTQTLSNNDIRKLNQGQEVNQRQLSLYKEELSKPIRFTYIDGKVLRFVAETSEAEWSINIKKSILSLFQLDLAPTKIIKSATSQKLEDIYGAPNAEYAIQESTVMPIVYPIYEETFGGICETLYEIDSADNNEQQQQQETVDYNDVLNVTKTVNYKNCLTDPSVSYDRHSFNVNTQTVRGKLFNKQTVAGQNYYSVPEEVKSKYSNVYTAGDHQNNVASPVPVERHSWTKYNISTAPQQNAAQRGRAQQPIDTDVGVIEGVFSEGKIKYEADGNILISETQQSLKLITCAPTNEIARVAPDVGALAISAVRQPSVEYQTIQCELNAQKLKFYQAIWKYSQLQQSLQRSNTIGGAPSSALYSHQLTLPFALSASWYPLVATGLDTAEQSIERAVDPELLAKSYEQLLKSLADDVLTEDVAQSKKSTEKVVKLVNIVAFMPKQKLAEVYDKIVRKIQTEKQQQAGSRGKQAVVDNDTVAKAKIVRKLFLDSLPLAGSKQAIEMIELLIESNRVKTHEAKEMCEAVPSNLRYPDTEIIDAFIRISHLPQVRQSRSLFASCSIACGKMIGQAYSKSKDASYKPTTYESANKLPTHLREDDLVKQVVAEADPRRQLPINWNSPDQQELYERLVLDGQDLVKYVTLYKQMLNKAATYHEKIIYIETLAHMKVPQVIPILEPFVSGRLSLAQCLGNQPLDISRPTEQSQWYTYNGRQRYATASRFQQTAEQSASQQQQDWDEQDSNGAEECNFMRTIAIYAMAHVARSTPNKVQQLLLPVFDNTYEPYQIRIAAFTTLMLTPVEEHILERIASQMWHEPSKEVASFVVGAIDTMSKKNAPAQAPLKYAALKAAQSMPKQYLDTWKYSWFAGGDHFSHKRQDGYSWISEIVKSNVSTIPRGGYAHFGRYHGSSGDKFDNILEVGFTAKGLESLLKQYVAYNKQTGGSSADSSSIFDETNIIASIIENLYDTKDDIVRHYYEARDAVKASMMSPKEEQVLTGEPLSRNFFLKRQQPIDGVNTPAGKQARDASQLFEGVRSKRSITLQARSSTDDDEEAKMTFFAKLFDQTSYHAMDKIQILSLLKRADEYVKMAADELIMGGKLNYVKMMMPSNMWHMVPSQLGLPVIVTHRTPIVASITVDGSANGQLTSNKLSQYYRQQATGSQIPNTVGQNFATKNGLNITVYVHPKIMHSNYRFMFAVEQASNNAYGAQVEKSHQMSTPMEVSAAFSRPKELVSVTIEPKTPARMVWTKEAAKTFIGQVSLASTQPERWLGDEHMVRVPSQQSQYKRHQRQESFVPSLLNGVQSLLDEPKESQNSAIEELETPIKFERTYAQKLLGLKLTVEGATDDEDVAQTLSKSFLSKKTRGQSQWSSTDDVDELDQHSKSGPLGEVLHLIDAAANRPSKYLEFYSTLEPEQSHKSPVYRFDFVLSGKKMNPQQQNRYASVAGLRRPSGGRASLEQSARLLQTIEQSKRYNRIQQQQQPIMLDVY